MQKNWDRWFNWLPPEENQYIEKYTRKFDIHNIRLITPTTDNKRLKKNFETYKWFLFNIFL